VLERKATPRVFNLYDEYDRLAKTGQKNLCDKWESRGYTYGCRLDRTTGPASLGSLAANNLHSLVNVLTKPNDLKVLSRYDDARNLNLF
jgi:hypothetical protein